MLTFLWFPVSHVVMINFLLSSSPKNFSLGEIPKRFPGFPVLQHWWIELCPGSVGTAKAAGKHACHRVLPAQTCWQIISDLFPDCSLRCVWCRRLTPRRCTPWNTWTNRSVWSVMKWEMFSRSCRLCRAWNTLSWLIYGKRWLRGSLGSSAVGYRSLWDQTLCICFKPILGAAGLCHWLGLLFQGNPV